MGAAYADGLDFTADGLTSLGTKTVTVCAGQAATFDVLVAARRNGAGTGNIFANSSTVAIAVDSVSSPLTASLDKTTITIPSTWSGMANNTLSADSAKATFTLPAQTANGSGTAKLTYSGVNTAGGAVTGNNSVSISWTVSQCDKTPPTLHLPGDFTVEATGASGATVTYAATADDVAPAHPAVTCAPASGSVFALGATKVSCSATDTAGNKATGDFTVTVRDTTPPVISNLPQDISMEATGATTAVTWSQPTALDAVSGSRTVACTPASGTAFTVGSHTIACSATDAAGNEATASFTVDVGDTTAPVLAVPSGIVAEATGPDGAAAGYETSATDVVDGAITPVCAPASGSTFALGTTTVECTATDAAGNKASATFPVTIQDTTAPDVTVPDSQTLEATGPGGAVGEFSASASDIVSGTVTATCDVPSGSTFPLGTTKVTCSATDAAGNTGSASFTVTVRDTTPPTISVPDTQVVEATGPNGAAASFTVKATDLVDGTFDASCVPASGSTFQIGSTQVDCTATDKAGNHADVRSFAVVVQDTTPPTVTVPGDFDVEATGPDGAAVTPFTTSATDLVDGDVATSCDVEPGDVLAIGAHTITCTATDTHENAGTASFTVTVRDTTPPEVTVPADKTVEATGPDGAKVSFDASAADLVDGAVTPSCAPASGSVFTLGTTAVTCTATDAHGNVGSKGFTVKVQDTTGPAISWVGGPQNGATYPWGSVPAAPTCVASDLVSGTVPCAVTGYDTTVGGHTMTASATDAAGNLSQQTRGFTVAPWRTLGFYAPVDMNGVVNTVKAGSTVPLKFEVFSGNTEFTDTSVVKGFSYKTVSCSTFPTAAPVDDVEITTTGGSTLRYDATAGQFIQNWQTPKAAAGTCLQAGVTMKDGSFITANFKLK